MKRFEGQILQGSWDDRSHELTISGIKSVPTQSVWDGEQIREMSDQVTKALETGEESLVITLRDAIPLILDQDELVDLNKDIKRIVEFLGH